jgi:hypothetical protein
MKTKFENEGIYKSHFPSHKNLIFRLHNSKYILSLVQDMTTRTITYKFEHIFLHFFYTHKRSTQQQ